MKINVSKTKITMIVKTKIQQEITIDRTGKLFLPYFMTKTVWDAKQKLGEEMISPTLHFKINYTSYKQRKLTLRLEIGY